MMEKPALMTSHTTMGLRTRPSPMTMTHRERRAEDHEDEVAPALGACSAATGLCIALLLRALALAPVEHQPAGQVAHVGGQPQLDDDQHGRDQPLDDQRGVVDPLPAPPSAVQFAANAAKPGRGGR